MNKIKVLFVCIHNSARSQMAEAFLNKLGFERFEANSAGLEPGKLNLMVVDSMKEIGIDISQNKTKDVFEFLKKGKNYDYVITVCDEANAERCPVFPGIGKKIGWSFTDPSQFEGTKEEKQEKVRMVRDAIRKKVEEWIGQTI